MFRWIVNSLFSRSRADADLDEELQAHLAIERQERIDAGESPEAAQGAALKDFGNVLLVKEATRGTWGWTWIEDLLSDARYALRSCQRSPVFTITAVVSLALGIGANAAIFNALYAVLLRPLPVAHPENLVKLSIWSPDRPGGGDLPLEFVSQLRRSNIFQGLAVTSADGLSFSYDDRAERVMGEVVSPDYFDLLGVRTILGQPFTESVRRGEWAPEAVLSYPYWKRRFGGDPGIIGRTIHINTHPFTIVGVSPPGFFGVTLGTDYELRIPILPDGREIEQIALIGARPDRGLYVIGRLMPGTSLEQAEFSTDSQLQEFLHKTTSPRFRGDGARHVKLAAAGHGGSGVLDQFHTPLYVLFVLVALVLLIACANVANMLLARATTRTREFAVRTSIGAGRFRLMRQLFAENLVLSLFAGLLAIAVGEGTAGLLVHFLPQGHVTASLDLHQDGNTILFTLALSLLASVLFGFAPALQSTRTDLASTLKADSVASIGGSKGGRFRKSLVVSQVAFSLLLLVAAGIFARTMLDLRPATDYGARPEKVLLFTVKPQQEIYSESRRHILVQEIVRRISWIPGVEGAGVAEYGPLGSRNSSRAIETERGHSIAVETDWISPGFFDSIGVRRISGRDFTLADRPGSSSVVIVNQSLARALFGSRNPIGRSLKVIQGGRARPFEIVGLVNDARYYDLHVAPQPGAWFAFQDDAPYMPTLHVRARGLQTTAVMAAIRRELDAIDRGIPVFNIRTLRDRMEDALSRERMVSNISGGIGALALALAAVGLYGILAYSVARRTREIGIRMALGSSASLVLWMVAREALALLAIGGVAGIGCSLAAYRLLSHHLTGVSPLNVGVVTKSAAILLIVSVAATIVPAIRASRTDPLIALRHD